MNRRIARVWAIPLLLAGCAGTADDQLTVTSTGSPALVPAVESTLETAAPARTSEPTERTPATTAVGVDVVDSADTADTAELTGPDGLCATLRNDGYESRKAALAAAPPDVVAETRRRCPSDLERVEAATAIETRRDAAVAMDPTLAITDFSCDAEGFSAVVTNRTSEPLGAHLTFRYVLEPSERTVATGDEPVVLWRIEPGQSIPVSGTSTYEPRIQVGCRVGGEAFLADDSAADAALDHPVVPALTGDDPATWLPALMQAETDAWGSGDVDAAAIVEDVRSTAYVSVVEGTDPANIDSRQFSVRVCPGTVRRPTPDLLTMVFLLESTAGTYTDGEGRVTEPAMTRLTSGVFRRGRDGQWRWLGTSQPYASPLLWESCGRPTG